MERCIFVFILGLFIFNWPFLEIFRKELAMYLYGMWLVYIVLLAMVVRNPGEPKKSSVTEQEG